MSTLGERGSRFKPRASGLLTLHVSPLPGELESHAFVAAHLQVLARRGAKCPGGILLPTTWVTDIADACGFSISTVEEAIRALAARRHLILLPSISGALWAILTPAGQTERNDRPFQLVGAEDLYGDRTACGKTRLIRAGVRRLLAAGKRSVREISRMLSCYRRSIRAALRYLRGESPGTPGGGPPRIPQQGAARREQQRELAETVPISKFGAILRDLTSEKTARADPPRRGTGITYGTWEAADPVSRDSVLDDLLDVQADRRLAGGESPRERYETCYALLGLCGVYLTPGEPLRWRRLRRLLAREMASTEIDLREVVRRAIDVARCTAIKSVGAVVRNCVLPKVFAMAGYRFVPKSATWKTRIGEDGILPAVVCKRDLVLATDAVLESKRKERMAMMPDARIA